MPDFYEHDETIRVHCNNSPWRRSIEFLIRQGRGKVARLEFESFDETGACPEPTFALRPDIAQELMDELWACGFRPTEGTGSAGSLAATQRHLEDMRRLVFDEPKQSDPVRYESVR